MSNVFFEHEGSAQSVSEARSTAQEDVRRLVPVARRINPTTPVPPRASAYPGRFVRIRPHYTRISTELDQEDITRLPTQPSPESLWQYDAVDVTTENTAPMPLTSDFVADELAASPSNGGEVQIADLLKEDYPVASNLPPHAEPDIAELDTQPPDEAKREKKTIKLPYEDEGAAHEEIPQFSPTATSNVVQDMVSWTAGQGANSQFAQRVAQRSARTISQRALVFHPFDRVRWWLLYPGRLEFVLWLSGTLFLLLTTCLLLLVSLLSASPLHEGQHSSPTTSSGSSSASCAQTPSAVMCGSISVTSVAGVKLTMLDTGQISMSMPLHLEGQGFTPHGVVNLTYDAWLPCQPAAIHADAYGTFQVTLLLTRAGAGEHRVVAYDVTSTHTIMLPVKLVAGSTQHSAVSPTPVVNQPTVVPSLTPVVNQPTVVPSPTPVVSQPTVVPSPTPVVNQPVATPTARPNPVTPTPVTRRPTVVAATPTPVPTATPVGKPTATPVLQSPTPQPTVRITPQPALTATPITSSATLTVPYIHSQSITSRVFLLPVVYASLFQTVLFSKCWHWLLLSLYTIAIVCLSGAGVLLHRRKEVCHSLIAMKQTSR